MRSHLSQSALLLALAANSLLVSGGTARAEVLPGGQVFQFSSLGPYGDTECIGAWNGSMSNGTQLLAVSCNPIDQPEEPKDQGWAVDYTDCIFTEYGDYCSVRNLTNYNKCMGTYAGSPSNGAYIVIWDCLGKDHKDQYWQVVKDQATGYYRIWNLNSGLGVTGSKVVCDWLGTCVNHLYDGNPPVEWEATAMPPPPSAHVGF